MDSDSIFITVNQGEDERKKFLLKNDEFQSQTQIQKSEYINMSKEMVIFLKILQYACSKYNQSIKSLLGACVKDFN